MRLWGLLWIGLIGLMLPDQTPGADKWIYVSRNLQVDKSVDELDQLMQRGAAAGYTKMLLADSKFSRLGDVIDRYFDNVEKVKQLSRKHGIEVVPTIFSIGYSNDLLHHNPNLAEALPVRGVPLVVGPGGVATVDKAGGPTLPGGEMSNLKLWSSHDDCVVSENGTARIKPDGSNARLIQKLKLQPYRQYHVRVRIKTRDFRGTPEIKALAEDGTSLQWANLGFQPTQDWTEHHAVFNSQKFSQANLYLGVWGAESGDLWWDDASIEEVAFLNMVRRPGAPLTVRTAEGKVLQEGTDYDQLADPKMGSEPWLGEFTVYHTPPELKTKLPTGTKLTADYYHALTVYDGQVMICPSEPQTEEVLRDQMQRMHKLWGAKAYMMSHDEIRCLNHCAACQARKQTPGQILADNARTCIQIAREVAPESKLYVWNDMFDPHHNAVPGPYYLVNGSLEKSWEGLDKNVIIVAWYFEKRAESLKFFADRGHPYIIAGYYDSNPQQAAEWLKTAKRVPGYQGIMYTTWRNNYRDLEKFSQVVDRANQP